ncbi:MAG: hypothetical protein CMI29_05595 [Opitutae bacterium]|nr:hypothetical protein [Opitutae bacterium]
MDAILDSPILAALPDYNPRKGLRAGATGLAFVFLMWPVFHFCVEFILGTLFRSKPKKPCKPLFRPARNYFIFTFIVFLIAAGMVTRLMPGERMSNFEAVSLIAFIIVYSIVTFPIVEP